MLVAGTINHATPFSAGYHHKPCHSLSAEENAREACYQITRMIDTTNIMNSKVAKAGWLP
jgi:hypothetical protein